MADQIFHEPVGDAEFGSGDGVEHRRGQPGRFEVEIDNQDPFTLARQMPCENRGGGAAPDAALDRVQRPALRVPFRTRVADRPPVATGEQAFCPKHLVEALDRLRGIAKRCQQGVAHEQDASVRGMAARSERGAQLVGEAAQGFPASLVVFRLLGRRYADLAEQVADQIDGDVREVRSFQRRHGAPARIVERNEFATHVIAPVPRAGRVRQPGGPRRGAARHSRSGSDDGSRNGR